MFRSIRGFNCESARWAVIGLFPRDFPLEDFDTRETWGSEVEARALDRSLGE